MSKRWTVNDGEPDRLDRYEWHLPDDADPHQHVVETMGPGELRMNPEDIDEEVTLAPKESGVQSGWTRWETQVEPTLDGKWYIFGPVVADE